MFVILSVSEGSDVGFKGQAQILRAKTALRMTSSGVVLNAVKDLFLPLKESTPDPSGEKQPSG